MVLCCLFWCQSFGDVSPYISSYFFGLGCWVATCWERAAHSVNHSMFFYILTICNFIVFSRFGFEGGIWVVIAPASCHCIL